MTATIVVGRYRLLPESTAVMSRAAKATKTFRSITPATLYIYDTILG
jgi:hypothetical protein